jgi:predicted phosphodiesterase
LGFLEDNFERIVLLGDIWETLTPRQGFDPIRGLKDARDAHRPLARRFESSQYTYVHGNHDFVTGAAEKVADSLTIEADGARLLFTHGHHHDLLLRHARWASELGVWLGAWLLRMRLSWLYRLFDGIDHARSGATHDPRRCTFQRWAMGLAEHAKADVVVTGHTHVPVRAQHGDRLFLNSGSCAEGRHSFLALDTRRGDYAVHSSY